MVHISGGSLSAMASKGCAVRVVDCETVIDLTNDQSDDESLDKRRKFVDESLEKGEESGDESVGKAVGESGDDNGEEFSFSEEDGFTTRKRLHIKG